MSYRYSDETTGQYWRYLEAIKSKNAFTYSEVAEALEVSERTITRFFSGDIIRLDILEQVLGMNGFSFEISSDIEKD